MRTKWELFSRKFVETLNATESAIFAGYSEKTAYSQGSRLLKNAEIQARIQELIEESKLDAEAVLVSLGKMARGELPTKTTKYKDGDIREDFDVIKAIELIGKYHALFAEKHIISELDGLEVMDDEETGS